MLRRVVSAIVLVAIASSPVVARTRLFCRYTGIEITECAEQVSGNGVVQVAGCCDHRITRPAGALLQGRDHPIAPPPLHLLPAISMAHSSDRALPAERAHRCESPTGPPVYLITRALLI